MENDGPLTTMPVYIPTEEGIDAQVSMATATLSDERTLVVTFDDSAPARGILDLYKRGTDIGITFVMRPNYKENN